jgi:hypothetical protein
MSNKELPSFDFVVPISVSDYGARILAEKACKTAFGMTDFDIIEIYLEKSGYIETPRGTVEGKRYVVVYRNNLPH